MLIDAETYEQLAPDQAIHDTAIIPPQYTLKEWEELVEIAETAASVGVAISIWEIIICFSLQKALTSMWVMVNTMQFFALMSIW